MNSRTRNLTWMLVSLLVGCGTAAPPRTAVIGEISFNGAPVSAAQVYLSAKNVTKRTPATYSATVSNGAFEFKKPEGPPPGTYDLIVNPIDEDSEVVFERVREKKKKALSGRDQFIAAVARKCPMRVELSTDTVNSVKVELTSR